MKENRAFLSTLIKALPQLSHEEMREWTHNKQKHEELKNILSMLRLNTLPKHPSQTIRVHGSYEDRIKRNHHKVGSVAEFLLPKIERYKHRKEVDLVIITPCDLGLISGANLVRIYERAVSRGLEICLSEVGPQLWTQFDQPVNTRVLIAMEPLLHKKDPYIFALDKSSHHDYIRGFKADANKHWPADSRWVFVKPR